MVNICELGNLMAKKKAAGRPPVDVRRDQIVNLKGRPEFKEWLVEFSEHCGLSIADTVGQALQAYGEIRKFKPSPRR